MTIEIVMQYFTRYGAVAIFVIVLLEYLNLPGFPAGIVQNGPKPFGKADGDGAHFGMGLYSSQVLCVKHGGMLHVDNAAEPEHGGSVTAVFIC